MLDDDTMTTGRQVGAPQIRLDPDRAEWRDAALVLEVAGGLPSSGAERTLYRFATPAARDRALERVRGRFGWTIASPFHGDP